LFDGSGEFINKLQTIYEKNMGVKADRQSHPYTDVSQLKRKGDFSCVNLSCGYYNMHTVNEFVVLDDVEKCIQSGVEFVNELGCQKYGFEYELSYKFTKPFNDFDYDEEEEEIDLSDTTQAILYPTGEVEIINLVGGESVFLSSLEVIKLRGLLYRKSRMFY
jgi:hypothetical protein